MGPNNDPGISNAHSDDTDLYGNTDHTNLNQVMAPQAIKKLEHLHLSITKMLEPLDDTNWIVWHEHIRCIFLLCGADPYVYSTMKRPN